MDQFTNYQHDPDNPQSLSNNEVLVIREDTEGLLWIGTRGGLDRFDRETETLAHYHNNANDPQYLNADAVVNIYETSDSTLWIVLVNDEQQREHVQEADGNLVLIKGYPADKLIRVIKEVLSG